MTSKDKVQLERIMKGLKCSEKEALDILEYDKKVDKGEKTEFDLPQEKLNVARKFAHTGTRKQTVYKFTQKPRKPNETKREIIAALVEFLSGNSSFSVENLEIVKEEQLIYFKSGEHYYDLMLTQKNKPR